jgi:hypothetical protein
VNSELSYSIPVDSPYPNSFYPVFYFSTFGNSNQWCWSLWTGIIDGAPFEIADFVGLVDTEMLRHIDDLECVAIATLYTYGVQVHVPLLLGPAVPCACLEVRPWCHRPVVVWHVTGLNHHSVTRLEVMGLSFLVCFCRLSCLCNGKHISKLG